MSLVGVETASVALGVLCTSSDGVSFIVKFSKNASFAKSLLLLSSPTAKIMILPINTARQTTNPIFASLRYCFLENTTILIIINATIPTSPIIMKISANPMLLSSRKKVAVMAATRIMPIKPHNTFTIDGIPFFFFGSVPPPLSLLSMYIPPFIFSAYILPKQAISYSFSAIRFGFAIAAQARDQSRKKVSC